MAWYRAGSISVTANSATVTGAGTAWVANVRVGDGLQGPDGRTYEITNIASNTALSIAPAYRGATASGQAYWIIPIQGYTKLLADRAAGLIGDYGTAKELAESAVQPGDLGTAASLNVPAGQTGFGNASAATLTTSATDTTAGRVLKVNAFGLGLYVNVPAGSVLTPDLPTGFFYAAGNTDLPVGVGTYGFLDVRRFNADHRQLIYRPWSTTSSWVNVMSAGTWTGWRQQFDEGNCTVTQNASGKSIRYPNGVQECFFRMQRNAVAINAALTGGGFRSAGQAWSFPQAFWELGCCSAGITVNNEGIDAIPQFVSLTGSTFVLKTANSAIASSPSLVVEMRAIGLWKQPS